MKYAALLFSATALYGQVAEGIVVDRGNGAPLAGAVLSIRDQSLQSAASARSDFAGHFRISIPESARDRGVVSVSRTGYLPTSVPLPAAASADLVNMRIPLTPEAIVSGRVVDADGFPATGSLIQVARFLPPNSPVRLQTLGMTAIDDLGEYRIGGLPAGRYLVQLAFGPVTDWDSRYSTEFYGGSLTPENATPVEVKAGEMLKGIDLHLKRREGVTVSVRVQAPEAWGKLDRLSVTAVNDFRFSRPGVALPDGTFVLRHMPPGNYDISVGANAAVLQRQVSIRRPIEVGAADIPEVLVNLDPALGVEVSGQVLADGAPPKCTYALGLRTIQGIPIGANSKPDGTFSIAGVKPGHYTLAVVVDSPGERPPECHTLTASATVNGRDILAPGIDIGTTPVHSLRIAETFKFGSLTGKVVDSTGKWVGATVVFQEASSGRLRSTVTEQGNFKIELLPGTYQVFAATTNQQLVDLQQADYRALHANDLPAARVVEGSNSPITLTVVR
jgi:hypothetical protein